MYSGHPAYQRSLGHFPRVTVIYRFDGMYDNYIFFIFIYLFVYFLAGGGRCFAVAIFFT